MPSEKIIQHKNLIPSAVEIWTEADEAKVVNIGYKRKMQFHWFKSADTFIFQVKVV